MGDVVNLKRFKKRTAQGQATKLADANRARFGRTKAERAQEKARAEHASLTLDQHRLSPENSR